MYTVIIPAAGTGSRFGAPLPKQHTLIHGQTVLQHTLNLFAANPRIGRIVIAVSPDDTHIDSSLKLPPHAVISRTGGNSRAQTVANTLNALLDQHSITAQDTILVHDAARCCLKQSTLNRLLDALPHAADGAILAIPVADTLKRQTDRQTIAATVSRSGLWQAQTPQAFQAALLQQALSASTLDNITDEASAVEQLGRQPLLIEGDSTNIKLTRPNDAALAAWLLAQNQTDFQAA